MWRRTAYIIALGATLATCRKSFGQLDNYPELLITHLNWVRFDVTMGRILAAGHRTKQNRQTALRDHPCGASERLAITIDRGLISLQYSIIHDDWGLKVKVVRRDQMEIEWTGPKRDGVAPIILFTQPAQGDLTVVVRAADGSETEIKSPSLWHLLLTQEVEEQLVHIFEILQPDWRLMQEAEAIRVALLETDAIRQTTSRREIELLVDQLGDIRFRVRQRADRELRSRGRSALCFLESLDPSELDAEQRLRIQKISASLRANVVDSPSRVAAWLVNDVSVWLALLQDPVSERREIARIQIARIVDRPIEFDPTASEEARRAQVAALRNDLLLR